VTRALVNEAADPGAVGAPSDAAASFHASMPGYEPTPVRELRAWCFLAFGAVAPACALFGASCLLLRRQSTTAFGLLLR
jgi:hypothetical protein